MRLLTALLLSIASLHAESKGVNATKVPPPRKQNTVRHSAPAKAGTPTMRMPTAKGGAIVRAASGKGRKPGTKAARPPRTK